MRSPLHIVWRRGAGQSSEVCQGVRRTLQASLHLQAIGRLSLQARMLGCPHEHRQLWRAGPGNMRRCRHRVGAAICSSCRNHWQHPPPPPHRPDIFENIHIAHDQAPRSVWRNDTPSSSAPPCASSSAPLPLPFFVVVVSASTRPLSLSSSTCHHSRHIAATSEAFSARAIRNNERPLAGGGR